MKFFSDSQIRRYLQQFIRIFSDISIQTGPDANGNYTLSRVPVKYGDMSRLVATILKQGSENTILPSPSMAVSIQDIDMSPERRQFPDFVAKQQVSDISYNNGGYENAIQNSYSIEKHMPVPYMLKLQLDILTSTTETKMQLLEQILSIFNPSLTLQQNQNHIDWTSLVEVELIDITWSNRNIPVGVEDEKDRDVMTFAFTMPIWINPPAKIFKRKVIENANINLHMVENADFDNLKYISDSHQYLMEVASETISIDLMLSDNVINVDTNSAGEVEVLLKNGTNGETNETWDDVLAPYGDIVPDVSTLLLTYGTSSNDVIMGNIYHHPNDPQKLIFKHDESTVPKSMNPIYRFINPLTQYPNKGLPPALPGQRYAIYSEVSDNEEYAITESSIWGVNAYTNDIIEYRDNKWAVVFDSNASSGDSLINLHDNQGYTYTNESGWTYTYLGSYEPSRYSFNDLQKD